MGGTYANAPSTVATVAMQLSTILMAWGVPCFFMLTGFVWLLRKIGIVKKFIL